jgi:circadian clock protein KaiC
MVTESSLVKTGVEGLDAILLGGIPKTNVIMVQGAAGTGKSLLGMEFIYRGITLYNEPGLIVVFEATPDKLVRDTAAFGWNFAELEQQNKLKIVFTSPQVLEVELRSPDSLLLETAAEIGAQRIFIDGIGLLRPILNNPLPVSEAISFRELLQQLLEGLNRENLTGMFSQEMSTNRDSQNTLEMAAFLTDTLIELTHDRASRLGHRGLEVVKSRGQNFVSGKHTLRITGGKGIEVFRRVQAPFERVLPQPTSIAKRSVIGVQALDDLIGGGIYDGSTTMVVGVSGVGKTVLGTQLLHEGAVKEEKRGLLVSLDEHPAQIIRNAETLGIDLQAQIDAGRLHILYESPQELEIDAHYAKLTRTIEENDIQRLLIDGVTSYSTALEDQRSYRDFFHALVAFSKGRLMTTFFNYENPELFGLSTYMPEFPVSSIVDNIIVLSLVELGNTLHRSIAVVKARGCKHEFDTREFTIGKGGMTLVPLDQSVTLPALALESYSSVMSRAPTRHTFKRAAAAGER